MQNFRFDFVREINRWYIMLIVMLVELEYTMYILLEY